MGGFDFENRLAPERQKIAHQEQGKQNLRNDSIELPSERKVET